MNEDHPGFGVYIHWPFCDAICPYCDFNVHLNGGIDAGVWRDALLADLAHYAAETPERIVTSLYFGGGTPSLMPPAITHTLIDAVRTYWPTPDDIEITLEINPTSAEKDRMQAFADAGINRVSLGVQSFNDDALQFLGRNHSGADALRSLDAAKAIFDRVTFDLIYALPDQTPEQWTSELKMALEYAGGHISLYQLTIENGTPFFKQNVPPADEISAAEMFERTQDVLSAIEMPAYEISNHACAGEESRHNLTCWRGGDYVGIGPGAHGRLTLDGEFFGTHQIHNPDRWLEKTGSDGHGTAKKRSIAAEDRARELIMMGLRLSEGVNKRRFKETVGMASDDIIAANAKQMLLSEGLLEENADYLIATPHGRQRLNALLGALLN